MIEAGRLRHRITIQSPPTDRSSRGLRDGAWTTDGAAWAELKELSGTERDLANQKLATATHRVTIRHRRQFAVTTNNRFTFRDRTFEIGHVINVDEVNCILTCLAVELKP